MALSNSTTLNDLIGEIVSADAQSAAYSTRVMRPLVRGTMVPPGAGSIVIPRFQKLTVAALTEGVAPGSTTLNTDGVTLTPQERGVYVQVSKRALHADPFADLAPYGEQMGRAIAADEDAQIISQLDFTETATGATMVEQFLAAISQLEAVDAPGPYFAVFHPQAWAAVRSEIADAGVYAKVGTRVVEGFGEGFTNAAGYVGSPFGIPTFISTQVTRSTTTNADDTSKNLVFSREAVGAAWMRDIGVDVDDNVVARAIDLMGWYSFDCSELVDEYGVNLSHTVA